jgi:succinoglycan biosynthesis transport protein ExoP
MNAFGVVGALWRNRIWIIGPVLFAAIASLAFVFLATPRFSSTAQILVERQETSFTRPERETSEANVQLDKEAIASEVQVILSVDVARRVIAEQGLDKLPEFNPSLRSPGPLDMVRGLLGGGGAPSDPQQMILLAFRDHLSVYPVAESRVIAVEFWSEDAELSTRVANAVAEAYLEFQKAAIVETTTEASTWLQQQIADLRGKVSSAEQRVEKFRSENNLFTSTAGSSGAGARLPTLASQELSELSTQLTQARPNGPMLRRAPD